jgi:hypothetical protein
MSRKKKAFLALLLSAAAFRTLLPLALESYVNRVLQRTPEYGGRVDDVDLSLWRGAYRLDGLRIEKKSGGVPAPLLAAERVELAVHWKSLLRGVLAGEIRLENPSLNIVAGPSREPASALKGPEAQTGTEGASESSWKERLQELFPLKVNEFRVAGGRAHFRNFHSKPPIDLHFGDIHFTARNLTNSEKLSKDLTASVDGRARPMDGGNMAFRLDLDPYAHEPAFNLDLTLSGLELSSLNPFLRHYAGFDIESGTLDLFSEFAARDGDFEGYVKPVLKDLNVLAFGKEKQSPVQTLREAGIELAGETFKNRREDSVAAKVPFSGRFTDPDAELWAVVLTLFRHAFVKALASRVDQTVNWKSLK